MNFRHVATSSRTSSYLGRGADDGGQGGFLQPLGHAGGGAQQLGGGGAEVGRPRELRGVAAGR